MRDGFMNGASESQLFGLFELHILAGQLSVSIQTFLEEGGFINDI